MEKYKNTERRKYIRLKSVFPVEFKLLSLDGAKALSGFQQGFTQDVSKGGMLLRVNNIDAALSSLLEKKAVRLLVDIDMPLARKPVEATANIAWMRILKEKNKNLCMMGLSFEKIRDEDRRRLAGYAASLYRMPKLAAAALLLLLVSFGIDRAEDINLRRDNTFLIGQLSNLLQKKGVVVEQLEKADKEKNILQARLETGEENIIELQQRLNDIKDQEKAQLEKLEIIKRAHLKVKKAAVWNMYNWLKVHQNKRTGLIASYEGDPALKNTAFIYDQSLVAQVFLLFDDLENARALLDFCTYKAQKHEGGFTNAYGVNNGAITEYAVRCGPNIWLGIALMQYMDKTGGNEYLELAKDIAHWVIDIQNEDPGGGIRGGPEITWFSTEHNLDAYAFFIMLARKTNDEKYKRASEVSLNWIKNNTYTENEGRMYRGRGDSTIATDTFSWAIAAIGPDILLERDMDPDAIMKFAEDNCKVTVSFTRPDGKIVGVTGFDFAKPRHLARGGVVSSEWTAQMVVSLKIMYDFYAGIDDYEKTEFYRNKYDFYLNELEKLVIASPSHSGQGAGCLPYATQDNVDTGHGWRTPRGRNTGSVSGTAYGIFAIKGYNPLKLTLSKV